MRAHTARTAGAERAEGAWPGPPPAAVGDIGGLPWIEDAGRVAPADARELSRLFFDRLQDQEGRRHLHRCHRP
ncbi:hypothetical protein ACWC5G_28760, partial [Streptomyces sp. NPDC001274]